MKKVLVVLLLLVSFAVCFAQSVSEQPVSRKYVASTSWVASIAELAGLEDVISIAPTNLRHPPEYEISPDDVYMIANAEIFMHAGYERMMKTLSTAAEVDQARVLKVKTTNTLENLRNMVTMLSEKAGTQEKAKTSFEKLEKLFLDARERIASSPNKDIAVFANVNQSQFAEDLGLNVVSTFGSGQLTSDQIAEAAERKYALVIDNSHSPVASPVSEVSPGSVILTWSNFPDHLGDDALYNVLKDDLELLWSTNLF